MQTFRFRLTLNPLRAGHNQRSHMRMHFSPDEDFCRFTKDLALHITALSPRYIKKEDVPADVLSKEKDRESFFKGHCLVSQPFVKDPKVTIQDYLNSLISKTGENIIISRFVRFKLSEAE